MGELDRHRHSVAQIFADREGLYTLGTGFLISGEGHVLSCWHVIEQNSTLLPNLYIRFYDGSRIRSAETLVEHSDPELDYVVLKVEGQLPEPFPLEAWDATQGPFHSFGFRKNEIANGLAATGTVLTQTTLGANQIPRLQLDSDHIDAGMSGAPVWSESQGKVIGIVSESYLTGEVGADSNLAFAVPIESIISHEADAGAGIGLTFQVSSQFVNPFTQRGMVTAQELILGRDQDIQTIGDYISQGQSVIIVGRAQMGKSSLLRQLYLQYLTTSENDPTKAVGFIDVRRITSNEHFYSWLKYAFTKEREPIIDFDFYVDPLEIVLFLDDYHLMAGRFNYAASYVRGLAQASQLPGVPSKVVIASSLFPVLEIYPPHEYGGSNPGTIFREHELGPFSLPQASGLATSYLGGTGVTFTQDEIRNIHEITGGAPYELQRQFETLFYNKTK